jgi:hypothetical protein
MPVKVKKHRKPKSTSMKQKQSVSQRVVVNIGAKRNTGLQKVSQQAKHPQPNLSFVSHVTAPQSNDTSLLYRELFATREYLKKLQHASPFERALANSAAQDDRALAAEQTVAAARDNNPLRRSALASVSAAERLGLDVGTTPQRIGEAKPIQNQGVLGFTEDKRMTEEEYLQQRRPAHAVSAEFLREQRLFALKKSHNTLERLIGGADEGQAPPLTSIEEAISARGYAPSARESLEHFAEDHSADSMEAPDRKSDGQSVIGEPLPPNRLTSYLREHGTAGDIERYARQESGGSLHEQGKELADAEDAYGMRGLFSGQYEDVGLAKAAAGQGEGRQETGEFEGHSERTGRGRRATDFSDRGIQRRQYNKLRKEAKAAGMKPADYIKQMTGK